MQAPAGVGASPAAPEQTLARIYRELLAREVDPSGREAFETHLRAGGDPLDVVLAVVRSEEFVRRVLREHMSIPEIRSLAPERYAEVPGTDGGSFPAFLAREAADIDWLERQILENGYYEVPGIWSFELNVDKRIAAAMLAPLGEGTVLEIGCANGTLLHALLEEGRDAQGVEISRLAIARAHPEVQGRIHRGDLSELDLPRRFGLAVGLDVFEHMSLGRLDACIGRLASLLVPGGLLFANIPAIGHDPVFGTVCPVYLRPWLDEVAEGRLLSALEVDGRGYPLHGHLLWGPSVWWVRRFEGHGFRREVEIERALHARYDGLLEKYAPGRRCFYVFSKGLEPERREFVRRQVSERASRRLPATG